MPFRWPFYRNKDSQQEVQNSKEQKKADSEEDKAYGIRNYSLWFFSLTLAVTMIVLIGLLASHQFAIEAGMVSSIILGSTTFLAALTFVAVIFKNLNLTNKTHALGLPEGSIRAIIAICLIILFVIMSIFLFDSLSPKITEIEEGSLFFYNGTFINMTGKAYVPTEATDSQINLANDLITTVGTLVVALAGFYFGTRSVEVARGEIDRHLAIVSPTKSPHEIPASDNDLIIIVKPTPEDEPVTWETPPEGDKKGTLVQLEPNRFKYTPSDEFKDEATLRFKLSRYPDQKVELKVTKPVADQEEEEEQESEEEQEETEQENVESEEEPSTETEENEQEQTQAKTKTKK